MYMIYWFTAFIWSFIPVIGQINLLGMIVAPWFHLYFDVFDGLIQAYVFALLTGIYWSQEVNAGLEIQAEKQSKKQIKQEKNEEIFVDSNLKQEVLQ